MSRIKWIENKENNYRGNWNQYAFKVNNSDHIFVFRGIMTYKAFKDSVREFAKKYNCKLISILENINEYSMTISESYDYNLDAFNFKFLIDIISVKDGEKRQFKYFNEKDIFNKIL